MLALIKLLFTSLIVAHLLACVWILVGVVNYNNGDNWITSYELEGNSWKIIYLYSYYFATVTMTTVITIIYFLFYVFIFLKVGYGDISAKNEKEAILSIVIMFFASFTFGYILNNIGLILQEFSKKINSIKENSYIINRYLIKKKINKKLSF
jgi:hypothetical protein